MACDELVRTTTCKQRLTPSHPGASRHIALCAQKCTTARKPTSVRLCCQTSNSFCDTNLVGKRFTVQYGLESERKFLIVSDSVWRDAVGHKAEVLFPLQSWWFFFPVSAPSEVFSSSHSTMTNVFILTECHFIFEFYPFRATFNVVKRCWNKLAPSIMYVRAVITLWQLETVVFSPLMI